MPAVSASAPGKVILFGEHAVVYGRPAIAAPVTQVRAKATVTAEMRGAPGQVRISAPDIGLETTLAALPPGDPLALAVTETAAALGVERLPALRVQVRSTIPIAAGLGSGAAVSVAIARALAGFLGHALSDEQTSAVAYRVDQAHHGTPSGIDNTVITYAQPIWFVRGQPFEPIQVGRPFTLVIGNTGIHSPTAAAVADVRRQWQAARERFETIFDEAGRIAAQARECIEHGENETLGPLMTRNQALLVEMTVSSPALDRLTEAALAAGALGAKLCGGGRGGNMIALADGPQTAEGISNALRKAGAVTTIITQVGAAR